MTGPHVLWPPVHRDDQARYARRVTEAKREGRVLVTVLHRRGGSAVIVVDVFGDELTELQEHKVRTLFTACLPPKAYGKIRPWGAIGAGRYGAFTTNAVARVWEEDWGQLESRDLLTPTLEQLEAILTADDRELEGAA
jgi:hypothetical protein